LQTPESVLPNGRPATIASLGLQVRLVPADVPRERSLADLIASWEILRAEQERLFRQIVAVPREKDRRGGHDAGSLGSPDR
jgi:hypothetical protein